MQDSKGILKFLDIENLHFVNQLQIQFLYAVCFFISQQKYCRFFIHFYHHR